MRTFKVTLPAMQSLSSPTLLKHLPDVQLLSNLNALAQDRGIRLYLVGGSVRDLLLNREITDLDFAVDRDAIPFAKALADRTGEAFVKLDSCPPTARVVVRKTRLTLDFTQLRAETLETDLQLRDFTINAIAIDLSSLLARATVKLIDPCHGFRDIEAKRLRFPSPQVVVDDPLRMLRAYRLAAELAFELPEPTVNLIRHHKEMLSTVSIERVRDEFIKILNVYNSAIYLRQMDKTRLLSQVIPEIEGMRRLQFGDCPGLTVLEHCLAAIEMYEAQPAPDTWQPYHKEVQTYIHGNLSNGVKRRQVIKLGLMLHDVGNRAMKSIRTEDDVRILGRENVGAEITVEISKRLRLGKKVAKLINCLARNQIQIRSLQISLPPTRRDILRLLKNAGEDWLGVLLVSYALQRASRDLLGPPDEAAKLECVMREIADFYFSEILPMMVRGRLITGHDIIQTLGMKPGIRIGRILNHVESLQFEGKIHTSEEALVAAKTFVDECEA